MSSSGILGTHRVCDDNDWLPDLCRLRDFDGDWDAYEAELFAQFQEDWVRLRPFHQGKPVGHATQPIHEGKPEAFWHLTSRTDSDTGERLPDLRRCERLRWAKLLIVEGAGRDEVLTWRERRKKGVQLIFALDDFSYVVIVALRGGDRMFLMTAYLVDDQRKRSRLRKQYERAAGKGGG
jgi:hypothetical protein